MGRRIFGRESVYLVSRKIKEDLSDARIY